MIGGEARLVHTPSDVAEWCRMYGQLKVARSFFSRAKMDKRVSEHRAHDSDPAKFRNELKWFPRRLLARLDGHVLEACLSAFLHSVVFGPGNDIWTAGTDSYT